MRRACETSILSETSEPAFSAGLLADMQALAKLAHSRLSTRGFHSSISTAFPRSVAGKQVGIPAPRILAKTGVFLDEDEDIDEDIPWEERNDHGSSSAGHLLLRQQRHMLKYMRLIEHDMPNLVGKSMYSVLHAFNCLQTRSFPAFRETFKPPPSDRPLVVRSIDYGGEEHPATAKRTVVVAVSRLPLNGKDAQHAFKLLAGPRWHPHPPADSGIGQTEGDESQGYIKISCEDYPQSGMNLKWISDVLDRMIEEANVRKPLLKLFFSLTVICRQIVKNSRVFH